MIKVSIGHFDAFKGDVYPFPHVTPFGMRIVGLWWRVAVSPQGTFWDIRPTHWRRRVMRRLGLWPRTPREIADKAFSIPSFVKGLIEDAKPTTPRYRTSKLLRSRGVDSLNSDEVSPGC